MLHLSALVAVFALSSAYASPDCDKIFKRRTRTDPVLFLTDNASAIVAKNCRSHPDAGEIRATLTGEDLRRASSVLMNKCMRKSDPHSCRSKVNRQMDDIRSLNGGNFGQNEAERNQNKLRDARLEFLQEAKDAIRDGDGAETLYCCSFSTYIIYSNDQDHPLCESPAKTCPGVRKVAPLVKRPGQAVR